MPKLLKAYTTLEVIVVVGIILLISGLVVPMSIRQTKLNELSVAGKDFHSHVFVQQQNAFSGKNDANHGVYVENDGYWLFEGESFATSTVKDRFFFGKGINAIYGNTEVVFAKGSQKPSQDITIVLSFDERNYVILINEEGVIDSYVQK